MARCEVSQHWRLNAQRYRLAGEICDEGHVIFPPRDMCPKCGTDTMDSHGKAKIVIEYRTPPTPVAET